MRNGGFGDGFWIWERNEEGGVKRGRWRVGLLVVEEREEGGGDVAAERVRLVGPVEAVGASGVIGE